MGRRDLIRVVAVAAAIVAAAAPASGARAETDLHWETVARGSQLGGDGDNGAYALITRTRASARHLGELIDRASAERAAAVDFGRFGVLTVIRSFPTCGWSVRVRAVTRVRATVRIAYAVLAPRKGTAACQALTRGYEVVRVPLASLRGVSSVRPVAVR